jgi:hypothetical protein
MEHRGSKLGSMGFFNTSMKFLIDRVPSYRILEFWDFDRIREQATGVDDHKSLTENNLYAETFQTSSHMFKSDSRNSSYACKSAFFVVRVLVKARFLDSKVTDSKFKTVLFTIYYLLDINGLMLKISAL